MSGPGPRSRLDRTAVAERPTLRRVLASFRPHWRPALLGLAGGVAFVVQATVAQVDVGVTIDRGVVHRDGRALAAGVAVLLACMVVAVASVWVEQRCMARFAMEYLRRLRVRLLAHLYALDVDFFSKERSGRLVTRLTSDVENVQQMTAQGVPLLVRSMVSVLLGMAAMLALSPLLTLVALGLVPLLVVSTVVFNRTQYRAQAATRERIADTMVSINETLAGIRLVHAYGLEEQRLLAFARANAAMLAARDRTARIAAWFLPVVELSWPLTMGLILAVGGVLLSRHAVTLSAVLSFPLLVSALYVPIQQAAELANIFQNASASFGKVFAFLDEQPLVVDRAGAVELPGGGPGALELREVRFGYDDGPAVLRGVNLDVAPGERIALVGESGAGKSTLVKLIARFHDATAGTIRVDGLDVRDLTTASLRRALALVPQEGFLFTGSVADNIAATRADASRADVESACTALGIRATLETLPDGLDTRVGAGGATLSAGQRQLVALARAFLADPRLLILDEVTSSVDPATMAVLEDAFGRLLRGRTALLIAHRVSTALRADRVVMLAGGTVAEVGRPAELLARGGRFARWVAGDDDADADAERRPATLSG
jgi:ATP-binding cassette subfamily B protein